jgi:hypothetical protein
MANLTDFDLWLMVSSGDLEDLSAALLGPNAPPKVIGSGSCSALVKVTANNAELFAAQDTWSVT